MTAHDLSMHLMRERDLLELMLFKLETQVMHGCFGTVEQYQVLDVEFSKLPAYLAADGSGGTGYHHSLSGKAVAYLAHVNLNLVAPKQVFDAYRTNRTAYLSIHQFFHLD